MRKYFLLVVLIIATMYDLFGFKLTDRWLDSLYGPYTLYIDSCTNVSINDSLAVFERILFDPDSCIKNLQTDSVSLLPEIQYGLGTVNNFGIPLLRYSSFYILGTDTVYMPPKEYGVTKRILGIGKTNFFEISLNDSTELRWDKDGGGYIDSLDIHHGGVDINTILRHECGHAYGLDHEVSSLLLTLMSSGTVAGNNNNPVLYLGHQEILGFQALYDPPIINIEDQNVINYGDSIIFNTKGPIDYRLYSNAGFHGYISKNDSIYSSTPHFIKCSDDYYVDTLYTYIPDSLGNYKFKIYTAMDWNPTGDISLYETHNRPYSEVSFKVVANPKIEFPLPNETYHVRPTGGKGSVTDTLAIKVKVPEILSSYPQINIKIDDVYVNQGDITFDSGENVWVYNWDLSGETPTEYGKRYSIKAEIDGDPTDFDVTSIYLVEPIFFEDFETMNNFSTAGWTLYSYEVPGIIHTGWELALDPLNSLNTCAISESTNSTQLIYKLTSPLFQLPAVTDNQILVDFKILIDIFGTTFSRLYFNVLDSNGTIINEQNTRVPTTVGDWLDVTYDLSAYSGQSIKLCWVNYYLGTACDSNYYALDNLLVHITPDMSGPYIDFIAGNTADINEDMNLILQFNDNSDISSVTADYSIESDSDSITLYPMKGTYNYTGTISARDHECDGSISFKIKDSIGNETISSLYSINWVAGGGYVLTSPENVLIATENDSTAVITWDLVPGATAYKVYSSLDPYGTFEEDSTGTFTESRKWEKVIDGDKYFYYIIATDAASKENKRILAPRRTVVR